MKKLMIAAVVAAVAGVSMAADVYDYKASVKYVGMKKATLKDPADGQPYTAFVKQVKSTTLKGYLVTSPDCCCTEAGAYTYPGFLVVTSSAQPTETARISGVRGKLPKIFPADLLVQVWRPKTNATTWEAEGYLFAGVGKNVDLAITAAGIKTGIAYKFGDGADQTQATLHLFGAFNETPNDANQFYESWLDAAGFGKAGLIAGAAGEGCADGGHDSLCLKNLSGSVIGGLYLCEANTVRPIPGERFLCWGWDGTTDVISGSWSIKASTKAWGDFTVAQADQDVCPTWANHSAELSLVAEVADKIKAGFKLRDFDTTAAGVKFQAKWF